MLQLWLCATFVRYVIAQIEKQWQMFKKLWNYLNAVLWSFQTFFASTLHYCKTWVKSPALRLSSLSFSKHQLTHASEWHTVFLRSIFSSYCGSMYYLTGGNTGFVAFLKSFPSTCDDFLPSLLVFQHPDFEPESFTGIVVCEKPNNNLNHFKCYV